MVWKPLSSFFNRELAHPAITWKVLESHSRHLYDSLERINMKNLKRILTTITLVLVALVATQPALAGLIRVPSEINTIGNAIASSSFGDTILVAPGVYSGTGFHDLDFSGNDLYLLSEDGPETTILDGSNTYRIFFSQTRNWGTTVIRGFTFRNGQRLESWGMTGMVRITSGSNINFEDMIFEGGLASNGAAVHVDGAAASFTDCIFRNNHATNKGAIFLEQGSSTLENCLFENNTADTNVGAAIYLSRGSAIANNCTFQNNTGGTIYAFDQSGIDLNDCIIRDTTGSLGVVAIMENSSSVDMVNCLVNDNTASTVGAGGALLSSGGNFTLLNCTFANNTLGGTGSSLLTDSWDASTTTNTVIWGTTGGAAMDRCGTVVCSLIFNNDGGDTSACFDSASDGNLSSDPGFCDPDNRDYRIASNSPCLAANSGGCGLIGATESGGCTLVATEALNFGSVKAMYR
jgi:hypothetical protein